MHSPKYIVLLIILLIIFFSRCTYDSVEYLENKYSISLRWVKSYEGEEWNNVRTGLIWSFSFLGAELPAGSFDASVHWLTDNTFSCDLSKLGFNASSLRALSIITDKLKTSDEYKTKKGIDIGRFLMLTIYSSQHYYKITGVASTLNEFKVMHTFDSTHSFAVTNSGVALNDRLIRVNSSFSFSNISCIASEGTGMIADSSFTELEYEAIDLMSNSQLRFVLYSKEGKLKLSADNTLSIAGKPGKCMWCHESNFRTMFYLNNDVQGYMTSQQFADTMHSFRNRVTELRRTFASDIIYKNLQDHTQSELLYISFLEPSLKRIADEWGISVLSVLERMKQLPTHTYPEFSFLGNLYHRSWVDSLAPYRTEKTPESARESSLYEPDFFN